MGWIPVSCFFVPAMDFKTGVVGWRRVTKRLYGQAWERAQRHHQREAELDSGHGRSIPTTPMSPGSRRILAAQPSCFHDRQQELLARKRGWSSMAVDPEEEEMLQFTGRPTITRLARRLCRSVMDLETWKARRDEKVELLRKDKEAEEIAEATFSPRILARRTPRGPPGSLRDAYSPSTLASTVCTPRATVNPAASPDGTTDPRPASEPRPPGERPGQPADASPPSPIPVPPASESAPGQSPGYCPTSLRLRVPHASSQEVDDAPGAGDDCMEHAGADVRGTTHDITPPYHDALVLDHSAPRSVPTVGMGMKSPRPAHRDRHAGEESGLSGSQISGRFPATGSSPVGSRTGVHAKGRAPSQSPRGSGNSSRSPARPNGGPEVARCQERYSASAPHRAEAVPAAPVLAMTGCMQGPTQAHADHSSREESGPQNSREGQDPREGPFETWALGRLEGAPVGGMPPPPMVLLPGGSLVPLPRDHGLARSPTAPCRALVPTSGVPSRKMILAREHNSPGQSPARDQALAGHPTQAGSPGLQLASGASPSCLSPFSNSQAWLACTSICNVPHQCSESGGSGFPLCLGGSWALAGSEAGEYSRDPRDRQLPSGEPALAGPGTLESPWAPVPQPGPVPQTLALPPMRAALPQLLQPPPHAPEAVSNRSGKVPEALRPSFSIPHSPTAAAGADARPGVPWGAGTPSPNAKSKDTLSRSSTLPFTPAAPGAPWEVLTGPVAVSVVPPPAGADHGPDPTVLAFPRRAGEGFRTATGQVEGARNRYFLGQPGQQAGTGKVRERPILATPFLRPGVQAQVPGERCSEIAASIGATRPPRSASGDPGSLSHALPQVGAVPRPPGKITEAFPRHHSAGTCTIPVGEALGAGSHMSAKMVREAIARGQSLGSRNSRSPQDTHNPPGSSQIGQAAAGQLPKKAACTSSEAAMPYSSVGPVVLPAVAGRPLDGGTDAVQLLEEGTASDVSQSVPRMGSGGELLWSSPGSHAGRGMNPGVASLVSPRGSGALSARSPWTAPSLARPQPANGASAGPRPSGPRTPTHLDHTPKQQAGLGRTDRKGSISERGNSAGALHAQSPLLGFNRPVAAWEEAGPEQGEARQDGAPQDSVPGPIAAAILAYSRLRQTPRTYSYSSIKAYS
eukprot:jgi/Botrbrau1/6058/Bobra.0042s0038.1